MKLARTISVTVSENFVLLVVTKFWEGWCVCEGEGENGEISRRLELYLCFLRPRLEMYKATYLVKVFFFSLALQSPWALASAFFSFMIILQTVGLLRRVISSSQGLYLNTGQHKHRINTYTHQTSMPCLEFEPTIPASERVKRVHALDRSATVTGRGNYIRVIQFRNSIFSTQSWHSKQLHSIAYREV
jgi:hypothetical protein